MTTELAIPATDLSTAPGQTFFSDKQIAALRQLGVEGASNGDLAVFFHVASRTGLDPFARQIYLIGRKTKKGIVQTIQTGIDGFRLTARRAADRAGESLEYEDNLWCGDDGVWHEVWLSDKHPRAAKACVLRNGKRYPSIAHWDEYVQLTYEGNPNQFWLRGPASQLAKCAEALALRKAFPLDLSGVYADVEMGRSDAVEQRQSAGLPGDKLRVAAGLDVEPPAVVDETPDDTGEPDHSTLSDRQLRYIQVMFKQKGFHDSKDRHAYAEQVLDLDTDSVTSTADLTPSQARRVLDAMQELSDVT